MTRTKRVVPAFATEADEAEWWYKNRNLHGKQLLATVKSGEAQFLAKAKLLERIAALARKQAEEKGLPYQTYIKSLLQEDKTPSAGTDSATSTTRAPATRSPAVQIHSFPTYPFPSVFIRAKPLIF